MNHEETTERIAANFRRSTFNGVLLEGETKRKNGQTAPEFS